MWISRILTGISNTIDGLSYCLKWEFIYINWLCIIIHNLSIILSNAVKQWCNMFLKVIFKCMIKEKNWQHFQEHSRYTLFYKKGNMDFITNCVTFIMLNLNKQHKWNFWTVSGFLWEKDHISWWWSKEEGRSQTRADRRTASRN